ncbi:hypothetical protein ON010_g15990 [Phytophthora cinnamomi]|nr:hypothetical protein ON010_g15990 [Phytophthora cinnamomi]
MQVDSNEASSEWFRKISDALQAARDEALAGTSHLRTWRLGQELAQDSDMKDTLETSLKNAGVVLSKAAGRAAVRSFLGGRGVRTAHASGRGRGQAVGVERRVDNLQHSRRSS